MAIFPSDFETIIDSGGLGEGQAIGGFGGNPDEARDHHRELIRSSGKAPLVLVHGNSGTATHPEWGWLKVVNILKSQFNYSDEHLWALSYLGPGGIHETNDPYSKNIDDLRKFADSVRTYLDVDCIDMVGHSMGCHLILCYLAGLKKQSDPIEWDQGQRYANVGSVVLIDGAMQGLSQFTLPGYQPELDEWLVSHDVYQCIKPDHTPHGKGDPPTSEPAHNIKYWCCMVPNGYPDSMDNYRHVTGHLDGADENRYYDAGWGREGHEKVKDNAAIIQDWAIYLNAVPPTDPVTITVDKPSGSYSGELMIAVSVDPEATTVHYEAKRVTKTITLGAIETRIEETRNGSLHHGQTLSLATEGMWEVVFTADGAQDIARTYGIDIVLPQVEIITDNTVPFENTLEVQARSDIGTLFMNNSGVNEDGWQRISAITITEDTVIKAIAITSAGIASGIITKEFKKFVHEQEVGTVTEHFVAGRLDIEGYLRYGSKYGYVQTFTLYKINGEWTDDPHHTPTLDDVPPEVTCSHDSGTYGEPISVKLSATDAADPAPRIYYTLDGSTPTTSDTYFVNQGSIEIKTAGLKTLKYFSVDRSGNITAIETRRYGMEMRDAQPVIVADKEQKKYNHPIKVRISASDDVDTSVTVHYTRDGAVPSEDSPSFVDSEEFELNENGNYAISCMAIDSANNETLQIFHYVIQMAPVTNIFPNGGVFNSYAEVSLSTTEPVEWIKYTTDGSDPDESHGIVYEQAFTLTKTTTVKFRSMDTQGNLEDVRSAAFIRQEEPTSAVFENMADVDGYIMATVDGEYRTVVDDINLAVGAGWDGRISRAIVSFDTSSLPQGASITRAYIQVRRSYGFGRPWDGSELKIDVKTGKFGSQSRCQTGDWDEPATAVGVATIDPFSIGSKDSSDFTRQGREAIFKTGRTQMRLYFDPHTEMGRFNYVFLDKGAGIRLFVEYVD